MPLAAAAAQPGDASAEQQEDEDEQDRGAPAGMRPLRAQGTLLLARLGIARRATRSARDRNRGRAASTP